MKPNFLTLVFDVYRVLKKFPILLNKFPNGELVACSFCSLGGSTSGVGPATSTSGVGVIV